MSGLDDKRGKAEMGEPEASEARFAARARAVLLASVDSLDGQSRSQLTQARHAALAQLATVDRSATWVRWLAPAGGLAAATWVAVLWFGGTGTHLPVAGQSNGLTAAVENSPFAPAVAGDPAGEVVGDLQLMADADSLELLEEIEFYAWLDAEAALPPAAAGGVG